MKTELDFEFKRLSKDLLVDLKFLFKQSGKQISSKELENKYNTHVFGSEYIGFVAYDKLTKLPAAFYGVLPLIATLNNEPILIAQSADTITHPNYRKKGLFVLLANKTYDLCQEEGIKHLFGIPNYNSYTGFVHKLNWNSTGNFTVYTRKILTAPLNALFQKTSVTKWFYLMYVRTWLLFFQKITNEEKLMNQVKNSFFIPKNKAYLNYKLSRYHFTLEIESIYFIISFNRFMKIGYFNLGANSNFPKALKKLHFLAVVTGCHKIVFQELTEPNESESNKFFEKFKVTQGLPFIIKNISQEESLSLKIDYFDFDTF